MKININIDEIVLDDYITTTIRNNHNRIDERKLVLAIEQELSRIFKEKDSQSFIKNYLLEKDKTKTRPAKNENQRLNSVDSPLEKSTTSVFSQLDAGSYGQSNRINHDALGAQIAKAVYNSWQNNIQQQNLSKNKNSK